MNTRKYIFWISFVLVIGLIVWGLVVAMNKPQADPNDLHLGMPAPISALDHIQGTSTAPVTLIEYSDLQCPACRAYHPILEKLVGESSTTMRFVYRHFPLYPTPHKNAIDASLAAEAAAVQGKFWEMHGMLFDTQEDWETLSDAKPKFVEYAKTLGLNTTKFAADMSSSTIKDMILAQKNEGIGIGIGGTPTFFLNGKGIKNPQSYEEFKKLIDAAATTTTN